MARGAMVGVAAGMVVFLWAVLGREAGESVAASLLAAAPGSLVVGAFS